MVYGGPLKKLHNCHYCEDRVGLIYPEDKYAKQMDDGSWKCGNCVLEDIQKMKVRVLGHDHPEVKALVAEEQRKVDRHN